jgi:hypothetical protein
LGPKTNWVWGSKPCPRRLPPSSWLRGTKRKDVWAFTFTSTFWFVFRQLYSSAVLHIIKEKYHGSRLAKMSIFCMTSLITRKIHPSIAPSDLHCADCVRSNSGGSRIQIHLWPNETLLFLNKSNTINLSFYNNTFYSLPRCTADSHCDCSRAPTTTLRRGTAVGRRPTHIAARASLLPARHGIAQSIINR